MTLETGQKYHTRQTHFLTAPVVWDQGTGVMSVGWLPAGAVVVAGGVIVSTAFAAGGANTIDVGFRNDGAGRTADDNAFATLLDVSALGYKVLDELAAVTNLPHMSGAEVTVRYNGTTPTAGAGHVVIEYVVI